MQVAPAPPSCDVGGNVVVKYTYDTWGNVLSVTGSLASTVGQDNPFRYRGYYYDTESGLYYLQSRYYDPAIGRFINADGIIGANVGSASYNLYAYCGNNPVALIDSTGNCPSGYSYCPGPSCLMYNPQALRPPMTNFPLPGDKSSTFNNQDTTPAERINPKKDFGFGDDSFDASFKLMETREYTTVISEAEAAQLTKETNEYREAMDAMFNIPSVVTNFMPEIAGDIIGSIIPEFKSNEASICAGTYTTVIGIYRNSNRDIAIIKTYSTVASDLNSNWGLVGYDPSTGIVEWDPFAPRYQSPF